MADHGFKYENARRWQRMFGCSQDSVEWNIKDILSGFYQERLNIVRTETLIRVSMTSNGGRGPLREIFCAEFLPGAGGCEKITVEGEPVAREKHRGGRWYRG